MQRAAAAEREMQELRERAGEMEAETQQALALVEREREQLHAERELLLHKRAAEKTYAHAPPPQTAWPCLQFKGAVSWRPHSCRVGVAVSHPGGGPR